MNISKRKMDISMERMIENLAADNEVLNEKIDKIMEIEGITVKELDDGVFEVIKKEDSEMPIGDYVNPRQYVLGDEIEKGVFYWFDDYDLRKECIKSGVPDDFNDLEYWEF